MSRSTELAQIHIAKNALALTDDSYRDVLERVTGKRSAADMDINDRLNVLAEFKRLGWQNKPRKPRLEGQSAKIRVLWAELHQNGIVKTNTEHAMNAWIYRQTRVNNVRWLSVTQAKQCIEALKGWLKRVQAAPTQTLPLAKGEDQGGGA